VSYDIDGAREVTIHDQTGYLVQPRWDALVEPLAKLAASAELRTRLGQNGRERFTEQFRHEFMTRRIRELYEQVLHRNSKRA
jgi:glycosyltransferase involved in cell wall biosynthesis